MKSLLLKQLIQGRSRSPLCFYIQKFGCKSKMALDTIAPDAFDALLHSTEKFLTALVSLDENSVAAVATPQLQAILIPQIKTLRASHTKIKRVHSQRFRKKYESLLTKNDKKEAQQFLQDPDMKTFGVSPYVIFGHSMEQRLKMVNPWQGLYRLSSNRFIGLQGGLSKITNDHVYGFHCFYEDLAVEYEIREGSEVYKSDIQQFQVSFETIDDSLEFFVSDFNNLVQKQ